MQTMPSESATVFRRNIRSLMERDGITITQLAEATGMARPGLSRILSGSEGITLDRAERIAKFFRVPLYDLLKPEKLSA